MRVLAISFLFPNCVYPNRGIFVLNRVKAIQRYAKVKVINPIPWFPFASWFKKYEGYNCIPRKETIDGIEIYHPRFFSIPLVLKIVVAITYCLAVIPIALRLRKQWRYDLLHLHWTFPDLPAGRLLARILKLKQVVTVRGTPALHLNEFGYSRWAVKRLLPKVDRVITLSNQLKELCVQSGVPEDRIATVRNGVDAKFQHLEQQSCRNQLGLPADSRVFMGVGYRTPRKGFDRIIRAFPEILNQCPDARLYLVGPDGAFAQGDCTGELKQLVKRLKLEDRVHFVGEVANRDLVLWYNAVDLFCLSSRSEGCPNVVLEALACGCPVIATDVGAVAELVTGESLGIVTPNSSAGVRSGLLAALSRSFDRESISARVKQYDWDWCARQIVKVYENTLDSGEAGGKQTDQQQVGAVDCASQTVTL